MAFVRPYKPSDEAAVIHIFRETASPHLRADPDPDVLHVGSFLWARPYIKLTPEYCFVVDDGSGTAVGYVLGAPDTVAFVQRWRQEFLTDAKHAGIADPGSSSSTDVAKDDDDTATRLKKSVYAPEHLLHESHPNLVRQYPAHLHIDILPDYHRQGFGKQLLSCLFQQLRVTNACGVHLGMDRKNWRAGKFYDAVGFQRFDDMLSHGELGRKGDALYLVKSI